MNKQVFIINGSGGVGKDEFIKCLANACKNGVENFSSVDKVKEVARLCGWTGGKTDKDRKFLSDLKQLTTDYSNMPFNSMAEKVAEFMQSDSAMLFLHIREPENIEIAKNAFGAKTILVRRDAVQHITSNKSDGSVFDYQYDIVIDNNGTLEDLMNIARDFFSDFELNAMNEHYGI